MPETLHDMIEQSKKNEQLLILKKDEDDMNRHKEIAKRIPEICDSIRSDMDRDIKAGKFHNTIYPRTFQNVKENKDCESLADMIWKSFPQFGVSYDHWRSQKCEIKVHTHRSIWHENSLMNGVRYNDITRGEIFLGTKRDVDSECTEIATRLSEYGSCHILRRVDCETVMKRGMCSVTCRVRRWFS